MTSHVALMLSLLGYDDRTIIRTIALWLVREPNFDAFANHIGRVNYMIETYGICP